MATNVNDMNVAWEVRPTNGDDTNGGGFKAGATGTDRSTQNSAQVNIENSAITASTTGANSNTLTFVSGYTPSSADVGNVLQITGGTNMNTGFYLITAINVGSKTWTLSGSANATTAGGAGAAITGKMGGALQTIGQAVVGKNTNGNKIFVKAEATISITAGITFSGGVGASATNMYGRLIGYTSTRGDGGRVTIQLSTNSGLTALTVSGQSNSIENFIIDCNSLTTSQGISVTALSVRIYNCTVKNFTLNGIISTNTTTEVANCEVTGGTSAATAAVNFAGASTPTIHYSNIHDNACLGISTVNNSIIDRNLITNNTGASSDGIKLFNSSIVTFNTIYGNGRDGIRGGQSQVGQVTIIRGNIFEANGGYGINFWTSAGWPAWVMWDGNAFYNNTSGTRNDMDDTTTNAINNVFPYTNSLDVVNTTGSFFTNAAGGDFTLNNTANRGALARGTAFPGAILGDTHQGYLDFGVYQSQASGGGRAAIIGS